MRFRRVWAAIAMTMCAALAAGSLTPPPVQAADPSRITGRVGLPGAYASDAVVIANAYQLVEETPGVFIWSVVASAEVASDGTYSIEVEPGDYRIGFFDSANVYKDAFYKDALKVTSATTVSVASGQVVSSIDQTLTPQPELIVEGTVSTSGAPAGPDGFGVQVWQEVTAEGVTEWQPTISGRTHADGSYRIHLLNPGPFKLKFVDYDDVFAPAFYRDAQTVEEATPLTIPAVGTPLTGIDQTLSVRPSSRIAGADRYKVAVALSKSAFEDGKGGTVVIASGESAGAALAGPTYAYAKDAPILLVNSLGIPTVTRQEIERLAPDEAVVLGGPKSVPSSVVKALRRMGIPVVRRIEGDDRYEIAAEIARELVYSGAVEPGEDGYRAMVVNGESYWGATAAGPVAAAAGMPVLLVRADSVPAATAEVIEELGIGSTVLVGDKTIASAGVAAALPGVKRLSASDPYTAAAAVAGFGIDQLGMNARTVGLARGDHFANALAAGPVLARSRQSLVFATKTALPQTTASFLKVRKGSIARIVAVGDTNAVSASTFTAAQDALK